MNTRNPHYIYTSHDEVLTQSVCESLSEAVLFMTSPRFFKHKSISKCRVQMKYELLSWFVLFISRDYLTAVNMYKK